MSIGYVSSNSFDNYESHIFESPSGNSSESKGILGKITSVEYSWSENFNENYDDNEVPEETTQSAITTSTTSNTNPTTTGVTIFP